MKFKIELGKDKEITLEPGRICVKASPERCIANTLDEEAIQRIATIFADYGYVVLEVGEDLRGEESGRGL